MVHKISISYHKNRYSVVTTPLADGLFFMCFVVRIFLWNQLVINNLHVSVSRWNSWLEQFRFHVNSNHFCRAVFVHVWLTQLYMRNGVSFSMCITVEIAWLAQNIRQNSTRV